MYRHYRLPVPHYYPLTYAYNLRAVKVDSEGEVAVHLLAILVLGRALRISLSFSRFLSASLSRSPTSNGRQESIATSLHSSVQQIRAVKVLGCGSVTVY